MIRVILIIALFCNFANAYCYFVPCSPSLIAKTASTIALANQGYSQIQSNLVIFQTDLKKQGQLLEMENELLNEYSALLTNKLIQEKEIIFLLEKYNKLLSKKIDERSIK